MNPSEVNLRRAPAGKVFYQTYFQRRESPRKNSRQIPRRTFRLILGSVPEPSKMRYLLGANEGFFAGCEEPRRLPAWLKAEDIDYYAREFARTGFRGGLNWYRAQDIT